MKRRSSRPRAMTPSRIASATLPGVGRHRHRNPESTANALVLAQQHLEHDAVDRTIGRVERDRAYGVALLAEAVDAALALLVTRRIPGKVIVDDCVEAFLEVDAFAEAVGGDEHVLFVLSTARQSASRGRTVGASP